jgi:hypothetical protein
VGWGENSHPTQSSPVGSASLKAGTPTKFPDGADRDPTGADRGTQVPGGVDWDPQSNFLWGEAKTNKAFGLVAVWSRSPLQSR